MIFSIAKKHWPFFYQNAAFNDKKLSSLRFSRKKTQFFFIFIAKK
jgi:hypothetical protein